ncbi:hypothetical protein SYNPS1DRAFT_28290 [Syncephalis pseudoplumigaleata]|uniref:Uncharacterized protein n=1 Tax=Syncephalis pseudoplumigaleata TaxID=1712513 RepID=A0A4P9Z0R7_9FUNG|nr:hypothetical protein SYNPS1DRAFT_28290 [Syncephalis pseudoplumigaleata]|eukprot:RKP25994.1 hypothetical protein SYNPS1DRAFT_28290 [Syncephalis pseudoplumigaleata]
MNRADYGRLGLMVMMVTLMLRITVVVMTMMFMMSLRSPIEPVETATAGSLGDVLPIGYDVAGVSGDVDLVTLPVVYAGGLQDNDSAGSSELSLRSTSPLYSLIKADGSDTDDAHLNRVASLIISNQGSHLVGVSGRFAYVDDERYEPPVAVSSRLLLNGHWC